MSWLIRDVLIVPPLGETPFDGCCRDGLTFCPFFSLRRHAVHRDRRAEATRALLCWARRPAFHGEDYTRWLGDEPDLRDLLRRVHVFFVG
jgi:hypothetical protein